jgi:hypothetical protein
MGLCVIAVFEVPCALLLVHSPSPSLVHYNANFGVMVDGLWLT